MAKTLNKCLKGYPETNNVRIIETKRRVAVERFEGRIKKVYIKIGVQRGINVLENSILFKSYLAK